MLRFISLSVCLLAVFASSTLAQIIFQDPEEIWDEIVPSTKLNYVPCYSDKFRCARLQVPLDWTNETDPRTAAIAIKTLPATVPASDASFAGSILMNPGGPGVSGVEFASSARTFQKLFDRPGHRHYEIVGFDPRGVARSTPVVNCFIGSKQRLLWNLEYRGAGGLTGVGHGQLDSGSMSYALALQDAYAQHCLLAESKHGQVVAYVSTANVARDMLEMVDKLDEFHRQETNNTKTFAEHGDKPRLQYVGYSYGTFLGNTFASMFPGRVGRMILDGVVDAVDYVATRGMLEGPVDMDKIWKSFFHGCVKAGVEVCPFAHLTASAIQGWFWSWIKTLDERPRAEVTAGFTFMGTGDYLRHFLSQELYVTAGQFPALSRGLRESMLSNGTLLPLLTQGVRTRPGWPDVFESRLKPSPNNENETVLELEWDEGPDQGEATAAVVCSDAPDVTGMTKSWWLDYARAQESISRLAGRVWTSHRLRCASWPFKANWRFAGPFTTPEPDPTLKPNAPAAPILFLSSRLDPVTPLRAARKMATQHPGSRVVVQEGMGHTASSIGSKCLNNIMADYMETGKVPTEELVCPATCSEWDKECPVDPSPVQSWFEYQRQRR